MTNYFRFHFTIVLLLLLYGCAKNVEGTKLINTPEQENKRPQAFAGHIDRLESFPSIYVSARHIDIWLPDAYSADEQYAVLYMHDGQMLFDSTKTWNGQEWGVDETMSQLIRSRTIDKTIVVGIWNGGASRHADYFPEKPFKLLSERYQNYLIDSAARSDGHRLFNSSIRSDNYLKFIVRELKPFVDSLYSTHRSSENTFIMGSSMGGLISLYAICEYPEVFGGAACLSTHWPGAFDMNDSRIPDAFTSYFYDHLPDPAKHKLYFDHGTATLDQYYAPHQIRIDTIVRLKNYNEANWITKKFPGTDHSENAWRQRLQIPVTFLLSGVD